MIAQEGGSKKEVFELKIRFFVDKIVWIMWIN